MTPRQWKDFYARERAELGERGMRDILERAPRVELPENGAIVFPHTRLTASGELIAAAANAVVASGCQTAIALGVLHGQSDRDRTIARVHGPDLPNDSGLWQDEFSLDSFCAFVELRARSMKHTPPRVVQRFPLLLGHDPESLAGLDELRELLRRGGAVLVATTDPIHHGRGYGTLPEQCRERNDPATRIWANATIHEALDLLFAHDFAAFVSHAQLHKSDFRDVGPVLTALLESDAKHCHLHRIELVNYADVLQAADPTWVAAALVSVGR